MTLLPRNGMTSKSKSDATGGAVVDALAFSALFPAAIAFTFSLVSSRALDSDRTSGEKLHFALLAAAGSFVVYGIGKPFAQAKPTGTGKGQRPQSEGPQEDRE